MPPNPSRIAFWSSLRGRSRSKDSRGKSPAADEADGTASSPTTSTATTSRTTTFSNAFSKSSKSSKSTASLSNISARSSRRTSEELQQKPAVILSSSRASTLLREATGLSTAQPGDALDEDRLLAEAGIALCGLAGYSAKKTMELLHAMPEYGRDGSRLPAQLNVEHHYRGIQQRRSDAYTTFVAFDAADPLEHRLKADDIMSNLFGDRPHDFLDDVLDTELEHWRDTWSDEITLAEQHGQYAHASALRSALAPYHYDLPAARTRILDARARRLRHAENLERFQQDAVQRRAELASNRPNRRPSAYNDPQALIAAAERERELRKAAAQAETQDSTAEAPTTAS